MIVGTSGKVIDILHREIGDALDAHAHIHVVLGDMLRELVDGHRIGIMRTNRTVIIFHPSRDGSCRHLMTLSMNLLVNLCHGSAILVGRTDSFHKGSLVFQMIHAIEDVFNGNCRHTHLLRTIAISNSRRITSKVLY